MKGKRKIVVAVLGILFLAASVPVSIFLVNQRQEIRKEAAKPAEEGGVIRISLTPSGVPLQSPFTILDPLQVSLNLNTEGRVISGIAIRLHYNYLGEEPEVRPVLEGSNPFTVSSNIGFGCQVNAFTYTEGLAEMSLGCVIVDAEGYSNSVDTQLATLTFAASSVPGINPLEVNFNPVVSNVIDKATNEDILLLPDGVTSTLLGTYNVSMPIPTPTPTNTPIPTPTPTPTPIPPSLEFEIGFQGVVGTTDPKPEKQVRVTLKQGNEVVDVFENVSLTANQNGSYTGRITGLGLGIYDVLIKSEAFLQKNFGSVSLSAGLNSFNWVDDPLLVGDFIDEGDDYNVLRLSDIARMINEYTLLEVPVTDENRLFDVFVDRTINIFDMGLVLSNWTDLEVRGDE